jgi:hypothetical protein
MTTRREDYAFQLGVAVCAASLGGAAPDSREELEARIERLDADTYAAISGALDRAPYPDFMAAVDRARGAR